MKYIFDVDLLHDPIKGRGPKVATGGCTCHFLSDVFSLTENREKNVYADSFFSLIIECVTCEHTLLIGRAKMWRHWWGRNYDSFHVRFSEIEKVHLKWMKSFLKIFDKTKNHILTRNSYSGLNGSFSSFCSSSIYLKNFFS